MIEEKFDGGIVTEHSNSSTEKERNDKRSKAIEKHVDKDLSVSKKKFAEHISRESGEDKHDVMEKLKGIDFSKANPRNNAFMNELAFAGEGIAEGFLDFFGIEKDNAIERYEDKVQVIERKQDEKTSFFAGVFDEGKLRRLSPFKDNKEQLQKKIDEHYAKSQPEPEIAQRQTQTQSMSLSRQKEN